MILSYLGPFFLTFFIALFVLFMQFLWKWLEDFVGKGLELKVMVELVCYVCLTLVPMALPLAILLSSLMSFGNLGEQYELVALKSAGLSLQKIMLPLTVFTVFLSGIAFFFSNNLLPYANLKAWTLVHSIAETKPAMKLKDGEFYNGIKGYVLRAEKKSDDGSTLYGLLIYDHTQGMGNTRVTIAEEGKMQMSDDKKHLIFTLRNGSSYDEVINKSTEISHPLLRSKFKEQSVRIDLTGFELKRMDEEMLKSNYDMMDLGQIEVELDTLKKDRQVRDRDYNLTINKRFFNNKRFRTPPQAPVKFGLSAELFKHRDTTGNPNQMREGSKELRLRQIENATNIARAVQQDIEQYIQDMENINKPEISLKIVWHQKFTLSFACIVLFFIGAPLGAIIRKGGLGMPAVVSILLFILYYVISISGEKFAKEGMVSPMVGSWLSSFILLPLGIFLTIKATADSSLFEMEGYFRPFRKFFKSRNANTPTV